MKEKEEKAQKSQIQNILNDFQYVRSELVELGTSLCAGCMFLTRLALLCATYFFSETNDMTKKGSSSSSDIMNIIMKQLLSYKKKQ